MILRLSIKRVLGNPDRQLPIVCFTAETWYLFFPLLLKLPPDPFSSTVSVCGL